MSITGCSSRRSPNKRHRLPLLRFIRTIRKWPSGTPAVQSGSGKWKMPAKFGLWPDTRAERLHSPTPRPSNTWYQEAPTSEFASGTRLTELKFANWTPSIPFGPSPSHGTTSELPQGAMTRVSASGTWPTVLRQRRIPDTRTKSRRSNSAATIRNCCRRVLMELFEAGTCNPDDRRNILLVAAEVRFIPSAGGTILRTSSLQERTKSFTGTIIRFSISTSLTRNASMRWLFTRIQHIISPSVMTGSSSIGMSAAGI